MATPAASEPQRFGKYQIVERIAAGGMAEIFKARLDGIGGFHRTFAIKRILPHLTSNPEFVDMLVDEAKVAGLLSHANIVQILDLGSIDQQYYIAMEYVNGRDLGQLLGRCAAKGITLPVPHAVYVLLEILKGLEYAHNRQVMRGGRPVPLNIVHRDVSPANVLVSFQGEVKLTDFGIAKASVKALETMSGVVKGRFDYMSPEQASGSGDVDQRSDLYSAGVVLYEVLTGRHPFRQPGELATIEAIRRGSYEPPSRVNPDVPHALDLVVEQALEANPAERFATATAFKEALDRFFHDAGFIFSASTLAAFLKGLFPESEARSPATEPMLAARPAVRAPRDRADDVVLDDDSSAAGRGHRADAGGSSADSTLQNVAGLRRTLPDAGQSGAFGPVASLGDESTLIRPGHAIDPGDWSEAATAVRPDPAARATVARSHAPQDPTQPFAQRAPLPAATDRPGAATDRPGAAAQGHPGSVKNASPAPNRRPLSRDIAGFDPRVRVVARTPAHVHLIYVATALMTAVGGLLIGLFIASTALPKAPAQPPALALDPIVEIHFPEGAEVSLDGRPLPGPSPATTTLAAGRPSLVRITQPGHPPAESQLVLEHNQMRILDFVSVDLKKKEP